MADVDIRAAWWGCAWFRVSRGGVWGLAKYGLWVGASGARFCPVGLRFCPVGLGLPRWGYAPAPWVR
ncbi:hypothetical protein DMH18_25120 [Streptomyces sp. WAC 06783]|nr:hypothetical protein DMH18_25120 [Streptomyces sp. WAC 06783]